MEGDTRYELVEEGMVDGEETFTVYEEILGWQEGDRWDFHSKAEAQAFLDRKRAEKGGK